MILPGLLIVILYRYVPMGGIVIAFQNFIPAKGLFGRQTWVGIENFRYLLLLPDTARIVRNTLLIASMKIIVGLIVPIIAALLLNEIRIRRLKKTIQTMIYLPHFLSWVILGGVLIDVLSPQSGIVNRVITSFGGEPVFFLANKTLFPFVMVITDTWKNFGYSTILYLAAITNISPELYESAIIDGANRWRQTIHITLPGMVPIIVVVLTLSLGRILDAGFEQILTLYSPVVYQTGDIIDTFVYRIGLVYAQYSIATAVGLLKSLVSAFLISVSYYMAYRFANYRIF